MHGAILIYGANQQTRLEKLDELTPRVKPVDFLEIKPSEDKPSIGIEQVREMIAFVHEKPLESKNKLVTILKAHTLTIPAQNALLKTLEEPPTYAIIILEAKNEQTLLPTVVSRCQRIQLHMNISTEKTTEELAIILKMTHGERLDWVTDKENQSREGIVAIFDSWINEERSRLPDRDAVANIELISRVKEDVESTNVNLKLALEFLVLGLGE